jgi:chemotaxis protein MotB
VVGLASSIVFVKDNPLAPGNRRISIVVLNRHTEEVLTTDGRTLVVNSAEDVAGVDPKK